MVSFSLQFLLSRSQWCDWLTGWLFRYLSSSLVSSTRYLFSSVGQICFDLSVGNFICLFVCVKITATRLYRLSWKLESTYLVQRRSVVYVRLILFPSRSELTAVFVDLLRSCRRRARYTVTRTTWKCICAPSVVCVIHRTSSISITSYRVTWYYIIELDRLNAYVNKTTRLK